MENKKKKKKLTAPRTTAFCPLTSTTHPSAAAVNCSSRCSVAFYTNAHDFAPASQKQFEDSYLTTQTAYWIERFNLGYRALVACGEAVGNGERTGSAGAATGGGVAAMAATGGGFAAVATTTTMGSPAGTSAGSAAAVTVAESGRSGGSVLEGDVKTVIALGVLGLVAAAVLS